jgi:hypothetical protein
MVGGAIADSAPTTEPDMVRSIAEAVAWDRSAGPSEPLPKKLGRVRSPLDDLDVLDETQTRKSVYRHVCGHGRPQTYIRQHVLRKEYQEC